MKNNNRGITLIELVIAMAILGILSLMVYSFFIFGLKGFTQSKEMSEEQFEIRFAASELSEILRNVATFDLSSTPVSLSAGEWGIYVDTHQIILEDSSGNQRALGRDYVHSLEFSVIEGDNLMLGFTLESTRGYTLTTEVLMNNYGDYVFGNHTYAGALTGDYLVFTKP